MKKKSRHLLSPSILACDFSDLGKQVEEATEAGCDYLHIDVMDGHFVPNISFGAPVMKSLDRRDTAPYDVHLMIEDPDRYISDFVTEKTEFITVHSEACEDPERTLGHIKSYGVSCGLSVKPGTPVDDIYDVLPLCDLVLVMSVEPGFGGQKLMPETMEKVSELRDIRNEHGLGYLIEVDGGVDLGNVKDVIDHGADMIVAGSAVFGAQDIAETVKKFNEIMNE